MAIKPIWNVSHKNMDYYLEWKRRKFDVCLCYMKDKHDLNFVSDVYCTKYDDPFLEWLKIERGYEPWIVDKHGAHIDLGKFRCVHLHYKMTLVPKGTSPDTKTLSYDHLIALKKFELEEGEKFSAEKNRSFLFYSYDGSHKTVHEAHVTILN